MKITCEVCGKKFKPGNNPFTHIPNGVGLETETGELLNICSRCISMYPYSKTIRDSVNVLWAKKGGSFNE